MSRRVWVVAFLAIDAAACDAGAATPLAAAPVATPKSAATLEATFIGNMGFHLTDGKVAVLTDFPYQSGAFGYMTWSKEAVPSGSRPLCLFTHAHADHFEAKSIADFCGAILGPKEVVKVAGVQALTMAPVVRWNGIAIRPIATEHAGLEHYSYILEWAGLRLYFSGDTEGTEALLAARDLDAAFVSPWLLESVRRKGATIAARRVIVYHHQPDETVVAFQERLVPKQGQSITLGPPS